jgi:hypothetical protein
MHRNILFSAVVLCFCLLTSCEKEPPTKCLPPPDEGLENYGFILKDSTGQNMLTSTGANRLDTSKIKVMQPCTDLPGKKRMDYSGTILYFEVLIRPQNGKACNTAIVQWRDNDVDTITYQAWASDNSCGGTRFIIDSASIKVDGRKPERDTAHRDRPVYTLKK